MSDDFKNIKNLKYLNKMLRYRIEKRQEEKAWERWLVDYARMDEQTFIPFSQYFGKSEVSQRSTEDILKQAQEIQERIASKKGVQ